MNMKTLRRCHYWKRLAACAWVAFGCLSAHAGDWFDETKSTTLFAFDNVSIPHSQNLRLEMRQPARHAANPVVPRGGP